MRTANNELSCWVYKVLDIIIEQSKNLIATQCLYSWNKDVDYISLNLSQHSLIIAIKFIVLSAHYDCINALWNMIFIVFYSHLAL